MANTVKFIRDLYPNKKILANRGVFFYNPLAQAPVCPVSELQLRGDHVCTLLFPFTVADA